MAKWKETLEPYVKVIESVKTVASNPTAGEDMIVGAVIISDSGPATPTLITSQREFLRTYAAEDLTQDYTDSLDELYVSDPGSPLASTMWLNAYRLAGSTNMLVCRASKAKDLIYAKPIARGDSNSYVLKNTEVLKRVPSFKLVLDRETLGWNDGWAISVTDTGIIGNRVTDDGPIYDYKVDTLPDLVDQLNDTTKFFAPTYEFYTDAKCTEDSLVEGDDIALYADEIVAVLFKEVYLGSEFLDTTVPLDDQKDNIRGGVVIYDDFGNIVPSTDDRYPLHDSNGPYDVDFDDDGNEIASSKVYWEDGAYDLDGNLIGDGLNDYQVIGATGTKYEIKGMSYLLAVEPNWGSFIENDSDQTDEWNETYAGRVDNSTPRTTETTADDYNYIIDLNSKGYSGFEEVNYYATNLYNSRSDLQVRIRRFNHNAVVTKVTSDVEGMAPESPYTVSTKVLDKFTKNGTTTPKDSLLKYDFYEFAIYDPDISEDWEIFNVGQIGGRGDISVADLNDNLSMMHLTLPDNLLDLGLNYYGYNPDNYGWIQQNSPSSPVLGNATNENNKQIIKFKVGSVSELPEIKYKKSGKLAKTSKVYENVVYGVLKEQHYLVKEFQVPVLSQGWETQTVSLKAKKTTGLSLEEFTGYAATVSGGIQSGTSLPETGTEGQLFGLKTTSEGTTTYEVKKYSGTTWTGIEVTVVTGTKTTLTADEVANYIEFLGGTTPQTVTTLPTTGNTNGNIVILKTTEDGTDSYTVKKYVVVNGTGSWVTTVEDTANLTSYNLKGSPTDTIPDGTYEAGDLWALKVPSKSLYDIYKLTALGEDQISLNLSVKRTNSVTGEILTTILDVSNNDIMQAWDRIEDDERYVVEGMTDLGNTYSIIQNYMANIAVNSNYFYAVSTINSTNYMTIANKKQKITKDTPKLYYLAPWDYDDGTVGYLFNASPSVLYWECISRNRTNNNQFEPAFGQTTGIVTPVKLTTNFKKSERQLLLTKKVNTIFYDINIDRIYINDSYTSQSDDNIRKEENIERSIIHISKNMPTLLNQFKGRINSPKTRQAVEGVIGYWFKSHMIPVSGELIEDYRIICDDEELNSAEVQRANKLKVKIDVRYRNAIKYITVYNTAYPIGVDFE